MDTLKAMETVFIKNENAGALTRPPTTCPPCQYSYLNVSKWCQDVTPWRHAVTLNGPKCHGKWMCTILHRSHHHRSHHHHHTVEKFTFFNVPTLTIDLWPWTSNSSEGLSRSSLLPNFRSVRQTVHLWERWITDRHTHTHRPDRFYTLDRWRGREKSIFYFKTLPYRNDQLGMIYC